jgi:uroporphyrin-3 C-methyltransferase
MNEKEPKPGVVIDVAPEPDAADGPAETQDDAPPPRAGGRRVLTWAAVAVAALALVVSAMLGYAGYVRIVSLDTGLADTRERLNDTAAQQAALQQAVTQATASVERQRDQLVQQREVLAQQRLAFEQAQAAFERQEQILGEENLRLQQREAELRAAVADVHRRVGRSGTHWIIAEAEYLLRIAAHRLILARDVQAARTALELADQRLRDTQDPGWSGVRAQIAREIAALAAFEAPDVSGLSARLAALVEQVPQLRVARPEAPIESPPPGVTEASKERTWDTLLDDIWAGFQNAVRIREHDQPIQAMLAPEQQFFLYENLRLRLGAARLGLARGDASLFRDNLQLAGDWLDDFFDLGDPVAQSMATALRDLQAVDLEPALPDVSQSLQMLKARRRFMVELVPEEGASQ